MSCRALVRSVLLIREVIKTVSIVVFIIIKEIRLTGVEKTVLLFSSRILI